MMNQSNFHRNHTTKKRRRLRKEIREAIKIILVTVIGSVLIAGMVFGAAVQESEKLAIMASSEVER